MTHRPNVVEMLSRHRGRWANIGPTLGRCVVFAGSLHYKVQMMGHKILLPIDDEPNNHILYNLKKK